MCHDSYVAVEMDRDPTADNAAICNSDATARRTKLDR